MRETISNTIQPNKGLIDNKELWNKAITYTNTWKGTLIKRINKYLPYSSFETDDFFNESIIVAFETLCDLEKNFCCNCSKKSQDCFHSCENFIKNFWGRIRVRFRQLADIPNMSQIDPSVDSKAPAKKVNITENYEENNKNSIVLKYFEEKYEDKPKDNQQLIDEKLKKELYKKLTEKEKKLIKLLEKGTPIATIQKIMAYKHRQGILMKVKAIQRKFQQISY